MTTNLSNRTDRLEALAETTLLNIQQQQTAVIDRRISITRFQEKVSLLSVQIRSGKDS